jgi:hypothetical protein
MRWVFYALVTAAWIAAEFTLDAITGDGNLQALLGVAFAVVFGFLIGRWWALAVPVIAAFGLVVFWLVKPSADCAGCENDVSFFGVLIISVLYVLLADVGIYLGVGVRQLLRAARSSNGPDGPRGRTAAAPFRALRK